MTNIKLRASLGVLLDSLKINCLEFVLFGCSMFFEMLCQNRQH